MFILHNIILGYNIIKNNGIVHRDLKPDNLIFKEHAFEKCSHPKIIDFGYS